MIRAAAPTPPPPEQPMAAVAASFNDPGFLLWGGNGRKKQGFPP